MGEAEEFAKAAWPLWDLFRYDTRKIAQRLTEDGWCTPNGGPNRHEEMVSEASVYNALSRMREKMRMKVAA